MRMELKKFGTTLVSRQDGKEAYAAFLPSLNSLGPDERIEIDFEGVITFTPSWADEFIMSLYKRYAGRLTFVNTNNASVEATLDFLEKLNNVSLPPRRSRRCARDSVYGRSAYEIKFDFLERKRYSI